MKKQLICILLALIVLAGCSDKNKTDSSKDNSSAITGSNGVITGTVKDDGAETNSETKTAQTALPSDNAPVNGNPSSQDGPEETVTVGVIPPIPEDGVPEIADAEIKYSDEFVMIQIAPDGTTYANGTPIDRKQVVGIIQEAATLHSLKIEEMENTSEIIPEITDTNDDENEKIDLHLANYVSSGKTDLAITDIKVFNNNQPGVEGVVSFAPGDTMLINLWCNTKARLESKLYFVGEGAKHKDSYDPADYIYSVDMFTAVETGDGQLFIEVTLPEKILPGIYELRFVCGTEEGYIPFYFG